MRGLRRFVIQVVGILDIFALLGATVVGGLLGVPLIGGPLYLMGVAQFAVPIGIVLGAVIGFFLVALPLTIFFLLTEIAENTRVSAATSENAGKAIQKLLHDKMSRSAPDEAATSTDIQKSPKPIDYEAATTESKRGTPINETAVNLAVLASVAAIAVLFYVFGLKNK